MHRSTVTLFSLAVMALASGAMGCSSTSSGSGGNSGSSSGSSSSGATTDCTTSATVSFKTDIIPIIQNSCSLTSVCHGTMNYSMAENLYLGPNLSDQPSGDTMSDITTAYNDIVGVTAVESTMKFVVPGDLANSFLWHKILGDMNSGTVAATCSAQAASTNACVDCSSSEPCGGQMPYLSEPLDSSEGATSPYCQWKNWITQGAMNN
jgi:hypothetical protein